MFYHLVATLRPSHRYAVFLALDVLLLAVAWFLAHTLTPGADWSADAADIRFWDLGLLLAATGLLNVVLGLPRVRLNSYAGRDMLASAFVAMALMVIGLAASRLLQGHAAHPGALVITGLIYLILTVTARLVLRAALLRIQRRGTPRLRVLIYGAGQTGQQLAAALTTDDAVMPVAFVDDEPRLQSLQIGGLRVHKPDDIAQLVAQHNVQRIVLAMPSAPAATRAAITRRLTDLGCEVHALPSFADLVTNDARTLYESRPVGLSDLLGRDGLEDQLPGVNETYAGRRILVTGAGGSIGSELCRQLIRSRPGHLVLLDHSEIALFDIDRELRALAPDLTITPILGSINDKALVTVLMQAKKIDIVLHAAAYKHVPMVEANAIEGMRNNVIGTRTVANAARDAGVERFILVSTDKAVRPTSVMGASKRFAEMIIQDMATRSTKTRFSMVRFGNVIGSSGSVIPLFAEQIARGGPVTLTHPEVTRYFMTIPEATRLVLLAGTFARGGDVFVLDMGKPVAMRDVARKMIEGSGHTVRDAENPQGDIEIRITGLRPGEKLHEELLIGSDMLTTPHPRILRAQEGHLSEIELAKALRSLSEAIETRDVALLRSILTQWIEQTEPVEPVEATVNE
ncbi:NDP-sugar epimerase, includes UDP-GlcNAc-inverting 4,6-dehydratase FlaA1 and capsular polysaccharide biosynthesis protein EpsC [Roseovarius azorensis]|uniref:NDP-sugar epimerase, includes UDP-GlcNAc-inverting 4,6-dehydratase FlaA1 and capsular polysaccharide biosynthesis protein EpsC n=1 Tax=Roseovarius azorensis TaxID=1287727 RepID=A0A1H7H6T5_9RHOB|nr:nucleoside-diphosphate sugar epimerase/dehydratase [Roseovarius azorensis]SEK46143.1 NDP-sugar epimerase, includes UDP-GlcNAc-inverting 4,6-dehydratase FlaA1 and capsular polysaccharide biosynthesis protein EpsC [Roseovarius azorensis]